MADQLTASGLPAPASATQERRPSPPNIAVVFLNYVGEVAILLGQALGFLFRRRIDGRDLVAQMEQIGVNSVPVALLTALASGAVISLYFTPFLKQYGVASLSGGFTTLAVSRELIPVLTGVVVAARAGSAIAAELGTMKVTEQIDALRSLAVSPVEYLVVPRLLAALIMLPLVAALGDAIGIFGGFLVAHYMDGVPAATFPNSMLAAAPSRSNGSRPAPVPSSTGRSVAVSPMRRTIAARMIESRQATAPVTLTSTVDATNLVNLRGQFKAVAPGGQATPSYTDFLVKLTALALRDHPHLNARWAGDLIELAEAADIGIAVDTESGLLVPVLRGAADLGLKAIAERSGDLIRRARDGSIRASELTGGTFTVTNLGSFGIESFTPIINYPECAILGLGRIARQPAMIGDRVEARERLSLSLTFDHRIVDGAPAARFLQALGRLIENPGPSLLS